MVQVSQVRFLGKALLGSQSSLQILRKKGWLASCACLALMHALHLTCVKESATKSSGNTDHRRYLDSSYHIGKFAHYLSLNGHYSAALAGCSISMHTSCWTIRTHFLPLSFLGMELGLSYRYLVDTAHEEGRIVLSCDKLFFRRRLTSQAYLVQGKTKQQQVAEVLEAFDLVIDQSNFMSRCGKCNGDFIPRCRLSHYHFAGKLSCSFAHNLSSRSARLCIKLPLQSSVSQPAQVCYCNLR